jgi:hypothetical protein
MMSVVGGGHNRSMQHFILDEMECALMGHRFHRGFTAAEKTELWDRWKRGESLKAIGRAFGKQSSSIYFLVAPCRLIQPAAAFLYGKTWSPPEWPSLVTASPFRRR